MIHNELDSILVKMKKEYGIHAKEVVRWMNEEEGLPLSTSTLSNYRKKKYTQKKKYETYLNAVKEYLAIVESRGREPRFRPVESKLKLYLNKKFYVYYRRDDKPDGSFLLEQVVLQIGNSDKDVQLTRPEGAANYSGSVKLLSSKTHLVFNLTTKKTREQDLKITVNIPDERLPEIALGVFSNLNSKGAMIAGSVVFRPILSPDVKLEAREYLSSSSNFKEIDPVIRAYLKDKHKNRIKTTVGIYQLESLERFIRKKRLMGRKNDATKKQKIVFVSTPMSHLSDSEYTSFHRACKKLNSQLSKIFISYEVFFLAAQRDSKEKFQDSVETLKKVLAKINNLDKFILIYPQKTASSSLIEIGMALSMKKECLIFTKNKNDLPYLIKDIYYSNVNIFEYSTIEEISKKLRTWFTPL